MTDEERKEKRARLEQLLDEFPKAFITLQIFIRTEREELTGLVTDLTDGEFNPFISCYEDGEKAIADTKWACNCYENSAKLVLEFLDGKYGKEEKGNGSL